ncbi:MAG TPA: hypothetical protein ENK18_11925 [Deltaproteobacteria bacterium]|nr:hypothetical protein [Deltaproteobacteria bacterium]
MSWDTLESTLPLRPILALLLALSMGCPKNKGGSSEAYVSRISERVLQEEGLVEQEVDLDANGASDIRNYYRERADAPRLLVRKELDLNRDGKFDVITIFDEDGNLSREDMDSDYDGQFDWTDHYKKGLRVMSEYDTDGDGKPNVFKYYIQGDDKLMHLDRKERDEDGDGKIDVWERFLDGVVVRTGRDTDGDGKVDERLE